jgi:hypothetical protein
VSATAAPGEVFGVTAHAGRWRGHYYENFCGLYRCAALDNCAEVQLASATAFDAFALRADLAVNGMVPLQMLATTNAQLVPQRLFTSGSGHAGAGDYTFVQGGMQEPLLAASLLAIAMT